MWEFEVEARKADEEYTKQCSMRYWFCDAYSDKKPLDMSVFKHWKKN